MKAVYGDEAAQAWAKLAAHTVTVTKSWYRGYSLFLKGEADVVLSYTTSPAYHVVAEGKTSTAQRQPAGLLPQVEVAAMLKVRPIVHWRNSFYVFCWSRAFKARWPRQLDVPSG